MIDQTAFPKAIVFDWDNTLVDSWVTITAALNAAQRDAGQEEWPLEIVRQRATRALRESFPDWFRDNWERARKVFYDHFDKLHLACLRPMPGAAELLAWLTAQQIPCFIVTNKLGKVMRLEVEHIG